MIYKHTQIGYLILFALLAVVLLFGIILTQTELNFILLAIMVFIPFLLVSFASLKVIIDEIKDAGKSKKKNFPLK